MSVRVYVTTRMFLPSFNRYKSQTQCSSLAPFACRGARPLVLPLLPEGVRVGWRCAVLPKHHRPSFGLLLLLLLLLWLLLPLAHHSFNY